MIQSPSRRIHRQFAPLSLAVSLQCATPFSPAEQTFDAEDPDGPQFSPDRANMPTVIVPVVSASASDGTWPKVRSNASLGDMKWYVDGNLISSLSEWTGKYSVDASKDSDDRGAITISRNIPVNEAVELRFEAKLYDSRRGVNIPVRSDVVVLSTSGAASDKYSLHLAESAVLRYNVIDDRLDLHEWKVARGMPSFSEAELELVRKEPTSYIRNVPFSLAAGKRAVAPGGKVAVSLWRVAPGGVLSEVVEAARDVHAIPSLASSDFALNMKYIDRGSYMLRAFIGQKEVARHQFDVVCEEDDDLEIECVGGASCGSDSRRTVETIVRRRGVVIPYPERFLDISIVTSTAAVPRMVHAAGRTATIDFAAAGFSDGAASMSLWAEASFKPRPS